MKQRKKYFKLGIALALTLPMLVSCFDNSYDLSKDIDSTVGLGSDGLALKFGSTDKIYLRDMLKVENNNMLDTLPSSHLYYLVKDGSVSSSTIIENTNPVNIADVVITSANVTIPITATYPKGATFIGSTNSSSPINISITDVDPDVVEVATVVPNQLKVTGVISSTIPNSTVSADGVKITFPDFVYSSELTNHVYTLAAGKTNFSMKVDSIVFPKTGKFGQAPTNKTLALNGNVTTTGNFIITAQQNVTLQGGQQVGIKTALTFTPMQPKTISGLINKSINPTVDDIQISNDLPDFLQDGSVQLEVSNPTLKIWTTNGNTWPFHILFKGTMNSVLNSKVIASATIPTNSSINVPAFRDRTYYFSQQATPFDITAISANAEKYQVTTLAKLVEKLPNTIQIDLKNGKISLNQNILQRAEFGKNYQFNLAYRLLVPLTFDANTTIVYTDSIKDLNDDLDKYEASGLKMTADIVNAVPLDLKVEVLPYGKDGKSLANEISVTTETAKAATATGPTTTSIACVLTAKDPASIKKLDKLRLKISAVSTDTGSLISNQYIQLNNIRLKLTGQIVGDFN